MILYTSLLYDTTPIHCTPLPLHPPVMNTQTYTLFLHWSACPGDGVNTLKIGEFKCTVCDAGPFNSLANVDSTRMSYVACRML